MQELQIPNGYFQLWNMYLIQQGIDFHHLDVLNPYKVNLEHVLRLPIDTQSPFSFFHTILQLTQTELDCPQLTMEMAKLIRPEHFGVLGYMATRSNSVAEALQYVIRFSRLVIDGADQKDHALAQQAAVDVVAALAARRLLDNVWHEGGIELSDHTHLHFSLADQIGSR